MSLPTEPIKVGYHNIPEDKIEKLRQELAEDENTANEIRYLITESDDNSNQK